MALRYVGMQLVARETLGAMTDDVLWLLVENGDFDVAWDLCESSDWFMPTLEVQRANWWASMNKTTSTSVTIGRTRIRRPSRVGHVRWMTQNPPDDSLAPLFPTTTGRRILPNSWTSLRPVHRRV